MEKKDKKMEQIITSLLDTDLYKFNMNQVIFHKHTDLNAVYYFKCRNEGVVFTKEMVDEINRQTDLLCDLRFQKEELDYLRSIRFIKPDYVEFLRLWHPIRDYVDISLSEENGLEIKVEGPMFSAMQFEIYLLAIVNEVYFRMRYDYEELLVSARKKLNEKFDRILSGEYTFPVWAEFGTRRRLSRAWQEEVIKSFIDFGNAHPTANCKMTGTSNVYFAYRYNLTPIGTYAHEFVQMYQGIPSIPLAYTNHYALKDWFNEYQGDNGIALTDTITTDLFLKDFDYLNTCCYAGVRHDSGDPYDWGEKMLSHYAEKKIDARTKTLLFSDSLDFTKCSEIYAAFAERCKVSFGVGTWVTNDTNADPLNIVIKLQYVNGRPVAKLSDVPGKTMCRDTDYEEYLRRSVLFRLNND